MQAVLHGNLDFQILCFVDIAGKKELESYEGFVKEYSEQLQKMELALDETLGEAWDFTLDPLALQVNIDYDSSPLVQSLPSFISDSSI